VAATSVEYFPGRHFAQSDKRVFPPTGAKVPAGQDSQVAEFAYENFPGAQYTHVPPGCPNFPAGHWVEAGTHSERNSNQNTVCVMQNGL
jgi:hypothetical protein